MTYQHIYIYFLLKFPPDLLLFWIHTHAHKHMHVYVLTGQQSKILKVKDKSMN